MHTKGPWIILDISLPSKNVVEIYGQKNKLIASVKNLKPCKCYAMCQTPETEANAHLIAAAPDMFEILEDWLGWHTNHLDAFNDKTNAELRCLANKTNAIICGLQRLRLKKER